MVDTITFYISAASDLIYERDLLSRIAAEVPVTLGWKIYFSPIKGERVNDSAIQEADVHILLLGKDIRAPVGYEWYRARSAGKMPLIFFNKDVPHTPAANDFIRTLSYQTTWLTYADLSDLRYQVMRYLGNLILSQEKIFALRSEELEQLTTWLKDIEQAEPEEIDATQGGAGDSSIILSTERFIPKEGVLIRATKKNENNDN